ncbi:Uncharacterised protein [Mesomycoplasma dispar]|uniref:Uncharacterized protein n=1 Tax=Mesomycoplasma dispar TaxID=86660 RepID=A0AAJ5NLQ3_9BACT|nr:hypothetical protein [Mesomycoplasma dispar]AJR12348.1 hypothetical protein MDIS_03120 [Mesomycoplasma dispar]VEU62200.1 Uncharacterised protein [Mesomycoplasma dispar]
MEIQSNSLINIKQKFKELRYRQVNQRDFISTRNLYKHWNEPYIRPDGVKVFTCALTYCQENFLHFLEYNSSSWYNRVHNPIEDMISIVYKKDDYIYRLNLEEIQKAIFFSKELRFFNFFKKQISKEIYKIERERYFRMAKTDANLDGIFWDDGSLVDIKMVVVAIENIDDEKNCQYSISFPSILRMSYANKERLKEVEQLIINEIQELIPFARPKNLENHREKIFDFLRIQHEYNSKYFDPNKIYLGQKIEEDLKKIENRFQDLKDDYSLALNVKTLETYENILEKFKKYGIKKFDLEKDDRSQILISWINKFGPNYRQHSINLFGKDGQKYYDELERWTNKVNLVHLFQIMFGPNIYSVWDVDGGYLPDNVILKSWASLDLSKFELYYFGGSQYGIYDDILNQFDSKNPVFWINTAYESSGLDVPEGWIPEIVTANLILLYHDGENVLYWIGKCPFYHHVYNGKYFPLNLYYNKKISDLERDIFLRGNTDPVFYSYKNELNIDVIRRTNKELGKLFDYIRLYEKEYKPKDKYATFEGFILYSDLLTDKEREILSVCEKTSIMYEHKKSVNFLNFRKKQYVDFRIKELFGKNGDSSKNDDNDNDENLDDFETE